MKLWLYGLIIVGLLTAGWLAGNKHGKAEIQAVLDEQRQTWQDAFTKQSAETAAKDAVTAARNKELDDAWKSKLAAAESAVDGLAGRLRRAANRAGSCAVSSDTAVASGIADGQLHASPDEIDRLSQDAWNGAAANTAKLMDCVARYNNLLPSP